MRDRANYQFSPNQYSRDVFSPNSVTPERERSGYSHSTTVILEAVRLSRELDIDKGSLASILNVAETTLFRIMEGRSPSHISEKTITLARLFIELHNCLSSLAGGDRHFSRQWIKLENDILGNAPLKIMEESDGFTKILEYLKGRWY